MRITIDRQIEAVQTVLNEKRRGFGPMVRRGYMTTEQGEELLSPLISALATLRAIRALVYNIAPMEDEKYGGKGPDNAETLRDEKRAVGDSLFESFAKIARDATAAAEAKYGVASVSFGRKQESGKRETYVSELKTTGGAGYAEKPKFKKAYRVAHVVQGTASGAFIVLESDLKAFKTHAQNMNRARGDVFVVIGAIAYYDGVPLVAINRRPIGDPTQPLTTGDAVHVWANSNRVVVVASYVAFDWEPTRILSEAWTTGQFRVPVDWAQRFFGPIK